MKLQFFTCFVPIIKRNCRILKNVCAYKFLRISFFYAGFLGFIGLILSLFDIIRIINAGSVLPCVMCRPRIRTGSVVSAACERDCRLISLVLSSVCNFLLVIGTASPNAVFYLPWLIFHAVIITLEFTVFLIKLILDDFSISKHNMVTSIFMIYNWLNVFCAFFHLIGYCRSYRY